MFVSAMLMFKILKTRDFENFSMKLKSSSTLIHDEYTHIHQQNWHRHEFKKKKTYERYSRGFASLASLTLIIIMA